MTTETPKPTIGEIVDVAFKFDKNEKEFAIVSLLPVGQQQPITCRAFNEELVARFKKAKKGMAVGLIIKEEPGGTYKGKPFSYRNIVGITLAKAGIKEDAPADDPAPLLEDAPRDTSQDYWVLKDIKIEVSWAIRQAQTALQALGGPQEEDEYFSQVAVYALRLLDLRDEIMQNRA